MQRVLVIGCSGAGKTHLAQALAARTGLPVVHLDAHFWRPGWVEPAKAEWEAQLAVLLAEPAWIMDGNYGGSLVQRLPRADTAILLDYPTWLCLWRVLKRTLRHRGRNRPDIGAGCVERFDWSFLRYVLAYRRQHRPRALAKLAGFSGDFLVLKSPRETDRYLAGLKTRPSAPA
ncbi:MAG: adenylate kinase [Reyranellaceae bacterium]